MKSLIHSKKFIYILLTLIIFAGIVRFSYGFFVEKKGTHSDEEWSFGLANSYYEPYIYSSDNDLYAKNSNKWIKGQILKNYLTVQKGERFSFGSVYYNMSCDTHPPLYFFVLHFFSSFFINQYILSLGFFINIFCYIIFALYMYKLLILISKSDFFALISMIFITFNNGTLSMMVYIRMYMMVTMFAAIFLYYTGKLYYTPKEKITKSLYIKLIIITCLGSLTHHFFLPFAFIITICICISFIMKKNANQLIKYATAMFIGVALSIILFPATIDHLTGIETFHYRDLANYESISSNNEEISTMSNTTYTKNYISTAEKKFNTTDIPNYKNLIFKYYFFTCLSLIFDDIIGFSPVSPYNRGISGYLIITIMIFAIIFISICFLCRKEHWFLSLKGKLYNCTKSLWKNRKNIILSFNWFLFSILLSILFIVIICSMKVNVIGMGAFTNRYLFIIYPSFTIIILYFIYKIICLLIKKIYACKHILLFTTKKQFIPTIYKCLYICIIISFLLYNNISQSCIYFFKSETKNTSLVKQISNDSDCIIVSSNNWYLTVYCPLLYNCNSFFFTSYYGFINLKKELETNTFSKNIYLILDTSCFSDSSTSSSMLEYSDNAMDIRKVYATKNKDIPLYNKTTHIEFANSLSFTSNIKYIGNATVFSLPIEIYQLR